MIGAVSRNFSTDWGRFEPRLAINGATYRSDIEGRGNRIDRTRWIPTFSADSAFSFERQATLFGRDLVQTLEPRFLYVLTPYDRTSSRTCCRCTTPRRRTSTRSRSTARTSSPATTASPTRTS